MLRRRIYSFLCFRWLLWPGGVSQERSDLIWRIHWRLSGQTRKVGNLFMQYTFLANLDPCATLQLGADRLPPAPDRRRQYVVLDDDVAITQEWVGIFSATHRYRGAFESFDKFNKLISRDAPRIRVIVTKTVRGNAETESTVAELPALQVGFDDLPYAHCA